MDTEIIQQLPTDILFFAPILPELWLVVTTMILLVIGVIQGNKSTSTILHLALMVLAIGALILTRIPSGTLTSFGGMFVVDGFTHFSKQLIILGAFLVILISQAGSKVDIREGDRFEFPILILFATLGMMLMVSANDLIALYMGLELQSLSLYVLAAINRDSVKSSEAGLKYFVLGALASGLLLYGSSLIYGFTGTTQFDKIATLYQAGVTTGEGLSTGVLVGLILVIVGLCFKVSAAPFHMWTPDVYEGSPTTVTAFFAMAPKVAAITLFVRVAMEPFGGLASEWQQVIMFVSALSMIVGAFGALWQTNIKRLLAYSSIGHVGYALLGLATASEEGVFGILVYLALYITMTIGAFGCILMLKRRTLMHNIPQFTEEISSLSGLATVYPLRALALAIFMLSMAGIPPLAGFWGKWFIFKAAVSQGFYTLAIIGVLTSVVATYYYLRIIKVMYFDEVKEQLTKEVGWEIRAVTAGAALFNVGFFLMPAPLFNAAKHAAAALLL